MLEMISETMRKNNSIQHRLKSAALILLKLRRNTKLSYKVLVDLLTPFLTTFHNISSNSRVFSMNLYLLINLMMKKRDSGRYLSINLEYLTGHE
jgi:hypothetical protein